jgi:hypothetical protein
MSTAEQLTPRFEQWAQIVSAVRAQLKDALRQYQIDPNAIEVTENASSTLIVRANCKPGALVQAQIALDGSHIDVTTLESGPSGTIVDPDPVIIQMRYGASGVTYKHDDHEMASPSEVAEIILNPILDCFR